MGVLGLLVGLLVLAATFMTQWPAPVQTLDAEQVLAMGFGDAGLPAAWEVRSAERLPDRRVLIELVREGAASAPHQPSAEEAAALSKLPPPAEETWSKGPKPWPLLEELPAGAPRAALLEGLGRGPGAAKARKAAFSGLKYKELDDVDSKGEAALIDAGRTAWGPYEVPWVHLRHYRLDGERPTFHDTVRVDLTSGAEAWLLRLAFPERVRGDRSALEPFLTSLQPLPETEG